MHIIHFSTWIRDIMNLIMIIRNSAPALCTSGLVYLFTARSSFPLTQIVSGVFYSLFCQLKPKAFLCSRASFIFLAPYRRAVTRHRWRLSRIFFVGLCMFVDQPIVLFACLVCLYLHLVYTLFFYKNIIFWSKPSKEI